MVLTGDWDEGNIEKCGKHGVAIAEIEYALLSGSHISIWCKLTEDPYVGEPRLRAVGNNGLGRHAFVVFTLRKTEFGTKVRPISARYMHKKDVDIFLRTLTIEAMENNGGKGKPFPVFGTDKEAEDFVATADLSEYDFSGFKRVSFEELMATGRQRHAYRKKQKSPPQADSGSVAEERCL